MKYRNNLCWLVVSLILALCSQIAFVQANFWEQTNGPYRVPPVPRTNILFFLHLQ